MKRREFNKTLGAVVAASAFAARLPGSADAAEPDAAKAADHGIFAAADPTHGEPPLQIGMLVYPAFTTLDLVGPHTFLAALLNVRVHLVWKTRELVTTDSGIALQPTATFKDCPANLDVLFVPGGTKGTWAAMSDPEVIAFLQDRGARARYVTSVCSGSMVLGAAGLLKGYKATSHWAVRDLLPLLGAEPVSARVVEDRNRITGGGVTAGIDFGLTLAARLRNETFARMLQLAFEYDPRPPFNSGSPESAGPELTRQVKGLFAASLEEARQAAAAAGKRLAI
jgi:cyclohexyl-isocyanide hydratase